MVAMLLVSSACTAPRMARDADPGHTAEAVLSGSLPAGRYDVGVSLPDGPGRDILVSQCLNCHELTSLELFSSFYGRANWRSLVVTMRGNGAVLDDDEVETVTDYLTTHFGTGMP